MKRLFAAFVTTALGSVSLAGSINLDLRADLVSTDYNDAASVNGPGRAGEDNYRFMFQTGRIDFKGNFNEELAYRLRFRFATKDQKAVDQRDRTNETLDFAYISHKVAEGFTLTAGKFASEVGGFEGNTSSSDMYLTSEGYQGTKYLAGDTAGNSGYSSQLYYTGVKLAYQFGDSEFNLQAANAPNDKTVDGTKESFDQDDGWTGAVLKLNMDEKRWGVIASYHVSRPGSDKTKREFIATGLQHKQDDWLAQLDYVMNIDKLNDDDKDTISAIVFHLRYTANENWTPLLKVASTEEKLDTATGSTKNSYMSYGAGVEYRQKKDDQFRYHLAANHRTMKPETGDSRQVTEAIAGFRLYADFLK